MTAPHAGADSSREDCWCLSREDGFFSVLGCDMGFLGGENFLPTSIRRILDGCLNAEARRSTSFHLLVGTVLEI